MKYPLFAALALTLASCGEEPKTQASSSTPNPAVSADVRTPASANLDTLPQKLSYAMGLQVGGDFASNPLMETDTEAFVRGFRDQMEKRQPALKPEEIQTVFAEVRAQAQEKLAKQAEANSTASQAFLEKNKARAEVHTLASGLQIETIQEGTGASPTAQDTVEVHYKGSFVDGTEFDSSYSRNQPAEFRVDQVIKGWTEALQQMKVGGKAKVYIPSDLAYGQQGAGGRIPPNAALVFEVELLAIKTEAPQAEAHQ